MIAPMLRFVSCPQRAPEKRTAELRRQDMREIYAGFVPSQAEEQASRCSQCGIPFCAAHCPLGNNIPDWLRLTAEERLEEAYALSSATNSFPEICGRICPQDRLCEGHCVIEKGFRSVTIGAVERFVTETAFERGWVVPEMPVEECGRSVGIVGAGPAGLACAERLRAWGYDVHVYDRNVMPGGLLMYGIPGFKLEKEVVVRRWRLMEAQGVHFHLGQMIGADGLSFEDLRHRHDAIFLATGVYQARKVNVPGIELDGVVDALDFLVKAQHEAEKTDVKGKRVVVIGGGDTAMDCARTAVRLGAAHVTCVYRRDRENMPGSRQEVRNAEEEGVLFHWLAAPDAFLGDGRVENVQVRTMRLGAADAQGRRSVEPAGGHDVIAADVVVCALGFVPENLPVLWHQPDLDVTAHGTLSVSSSTHETSLSGVFAGGDIVRGASLVVWAIRDGRDAAQAIHQKLSVMQPTREYA